MIINPNEYGSLLYNDKEKQNLINVINQKRIFRYSKCDYPYTSMCEDKIKEIVKSKYCLMTANGTSGLKTALIAAKIKPNERVLISSYTFLATALAPISLGAIPVPIELDMDNGLDIVDLQHEISKGCKAVIVVHFQGRTFNIKKIKEICKNNHIVLIEDACQAFGAKFKDYYAGTMADIGVYSFQQFKQLTCGEGGCVVTNCKEKYEVMRNYTDMGSTRNHFPSWDSDSALFGENYRFNNLNGAVLYAQLNKLEKIINQQETSRNRIMKEIRKYDIKDIIESADPKGDTSMNIIIMLKNSSLKAETIELGKNKNIELRNMWKSLYYDNYLFEKNGFTSQMLKKHDCSKTREFIEKLLVISIPPILTIENENEIINLIVELKNKKLME